MSSNDAFSSFDGHNDGHHSMMTVTSLDPEDHSVGITTEATASTATVTAASSPSMLRSRSRSEDDDTEPLMASMDGSPNTSGATSVQAGSADADDKKGSNANAGAADDASPVAVVVRHFKLAHAFVLRYVLLVWNLPQVQSLMLQLRKAKFALEQHETTGPLMIRLYACGSTVSHAFQQALASPTTQRAILTTKRTSQQLYLQANQAWESDRRKKLQKDAIDMHAKIHTKTVQYWSAAQQSPHMHRALQYRDKALQQADKGVATAMFKIQEWQQKNDPQRTGVVSRLLEVLQVCIRQISITLKNQKLARYCLYAFVFWYFFLSGGPRSSKATRASYVIRDKLVKTSTLPLLDAKRRIVLVHVGRTGGSTVRANNRGFCRFLNQPIDRVRCRKRASKLPETKLSQQSIGFVASDSPVKPQYTTDVTTQVWTLRNPVDRVVSWFDSMHPDNCPYEGQALERNAKEAPPSCLSKTAKDGFLADFYGNCFDTIEDVGTALRSSSFRGVHDSRTNSLKYEKSCSILARKALGVGVPDGTYDHLHFGYGYFDKQMNFTRRVESYSDEKYATSARNKMVVVEDTVTTSQYHGDIPSLTNEFPPLEVLVVNQEHIERDLQNLESYLSRNEKAVLPPNGVPVRHEIGEGNDQMPLMVHFKEMGDSATYKKKTKGYSASTSKAICCAIQDDIKVYINVLQHAANLIPTEKREMMTKLDNVCGGSSLKACA